MAFLKCNFCKIVFFIACFFLLTPDLNSQVTIGSILEPNAGALLDLKEYDPDPDNTTSTRGLGMPRVALTDLNTLDPIAGDPDASIGIVLYNTIEDNNKLMCRGIHVWNGSNWDYIMGTTAGTVTDVENNVYRTGDYGDAGTWMIENLRTKTYSDGVTVVNQGVATSSAAKTYVYPNNAASGDSSPGLLYSWAAATNGQETDKFKDTDSPNYGTITSTVQGICPAGWVVPSDYDWNMLEEEIANNPLKYSSSSADPWDPAWESMSNIYESGNQKQRGNYDISMKSTTAINGDATNGASKSVCSGLGFDILMLGTVHNTANPVESYGTKSYHWTSSSYDSLFKWFRSLNYKTSNGVNRYFRASNTYMFSVRCKRAD